MAKKIFSYCLLFVYAVVILQDEVSFGIHMISHASEVFSNQFSFHQHGNGNFHVHHHHGVLDTFKSVFQHQVDQPIQQKNQQWPEMEIHAKFHLPGDFILLENVPGFSEFTFSDSTRNFNSRKQDVLTPPPKLITYPNKA